MAQREELIEGIHFSISGILISAGPVKPQLQARDAMDLSEGVTQLAGEHESLNVGGAVISELIGSLHIKVDARTGQASPQSDSQCVSILRSRSTVPHAYLSIQAKPVKVRREVFARWTGQVNAGEIRSRIVAVKGVFPDSYKPGMEAVKLPFGELDGSPESVEHPGTRVGPVERAYQALSAQLQFLTAEAQCTVPALKGNLQIDEHVLKIGGVHVQNASAPGEVAIRRNRALSLQKNTKVRSQNQVPVKTYSQQAKPVISRTGTSKTKVIPALKTNSSLPPPG